MTRKRRFKPGTSSADRPPPAPKPVDMYEGIPDCSPRRPWWRWVLIVGLSVGWLAFLIYCWLGGAPPTG